MNENHGIWNIKSTIILRKIFYNLNKKRCFSLVKYNQKLQDKSNICFEKLNFSDYREFLGENRKFNDKKIQKYIKKSDKILIDLAIFLSLSPEERTYKNLIKTLKLDSFDKEKLKARVNDLYEYGQYSLLAFRSLISKDRTIANLESFFMLYNQDNINKWKKIFDKFGFFLSYDFNFEGTTKTNKLELIEKLIFCDRQGYIEINYRKETLTTMDFEEKMRLIRTSITNDNDRYKNIGSSKYLAGLSKDEVKDLKARLFTSNILRYINKSFTIEQLYELDCEKRSRLVAYAWVYGGEFGMSQVKKFLYSYPHRNENSVSANNINLNKNKSCIII